MTPAKKKPKTTPATSTDVENTNRRLDKLIEAADENPDCNPATKAYVKCLLQKLHDEDILVDQNDNSGYLFLMIGFFGGIFASFVSLSQYATAPVSLVFYALVLMSWICYFEVLLHHTTRIKIKSPLPNYLLKWRPPVCESKHHDDCPDLK